MVDAVIDELCYSACPYRGVSQRNQTKLPEMSQYEIVQPYAIARVDYPRYARSYPVGGLHEITGYEYSSGYKILTTLRTISIGAL